MSYMPSEKHEIGGAIEREVDITDVWCIDAELHHGAKALVDASQTVRLWVKAALEYGTNGSSRLLDTG